MEKMRRYARALAQPYEVQIKLFPGFVEVADELGLGWEEAWPYFLSHPEEFSNEQSAAIRKLDQYIESIAGPSNARFWTMEALSDAPEWKNDARNGVRYRLECQPACPSILHQTACRNRLLHRLHVPACASRPPRPLSAPCLWPAAAHRTP